MGRRISAAKRAGGAVETASPNAVRNPSASVSGNFSRSRVSGSSHGASRPVLQGELPGLAPCQEKKREMALLFGIRYGKAPIAGFIPTTAGRLAASGVGGAAMGRRRPRY